MGCFGGEREKGPPEHKQKWEFINLSDFKSRSCWTPIAYFWLWCMAFVSIAVYGVDTFTAVNLLVFDKWSSQVDPWIPFQYSKWIFAICILLSWALCIYEWLRAIRVIKRGGVAASYMDPLGASLQSMRPKGWKRFLVFTELTKSKKGTDYVAFFVYFAFQGALRVIICEGPRQVVNGLTIGSLFESKLINQKATQDKEPLDQFFLNIKALADENLQQVLILGSMLFTLIIWIFSAICLAIAAILYLVFLWHYIPQRDGRLRIYCRRKIDRRLERIVEERTRDAIEEENKQKEKEEWKAEMKRQKTGELAPPAPPKIARQPTLPQLGETPKLEQEAKMSEGGLQRQDTSTTVSTLPRYTSRPSTSQGMQRQPTVPDLASGGDRPTMSRNASGWSEVSCESDAPLLPNAGYAGEGGRASPAPTYYSRQDSNASFNRRPAPGRNMSQSTQASQRSFTPVSRVNTPGSERSFTPMNQRPPMPGVRFPVRSNTGFSFDRDQRSASSPISPPDVYGRPMVPTMRSATEPPRASGLSREDSNTSYFNRPVAGTPAPGIERKPTFGSLHSHNSSFSRPIPRNPSQASSFHRPCSPENAPPATNSYEMTSQPSYTPAPRATSGAGGYVAFNPGMHKASSTPAPQQAQGVPPRAATAPNSNRLTTGYADILDDYGGGEEDRGPPPRSYTAGPAHTPGWQGRF
ncbi:Potassium transporter [Saxophila tyrrhenica]|uniref:Potassium transporter n=1 Tax=Saxophila tyrrhenica TaxID=1690608 RepID=A0AAV9NZE7_9PEZI|nr:Potassium transporter [Saxophila tyrrhenica]